MTDLGLILGISYSMKSILKDIFTNGIFYLCIFNILMICYISYSVSCIEYEPLLCPDGICDRSDIVFLKPLDCATYNAMLVAVLVNCVVVAWNLFVHKTKGDKCDLLIKLSYFVIICISFALVYVHLRLTLHAGIIATGNLLFIIPIRLFGEGFVQDNLSVTNVFVSLYVLLVIVTLTNIYRTINAANRYIIAHL